MPHFGDTLSIGKRVAWWEAIEERLNVSARIVGEDFVLNTVHPAAIEDARQVGVEFGITVTVVGQTETATTVRLS